MFIQLFNGEGPKPQRSVEVFNAVSEAAKKGRALYFDRTTGRLFAAGGGFWARVWHYLFKPCCHRIENVDEFRIRIRDARDRSADGSDTRRKLDDVLNKIGVYLKKGSALIPSDDPPKATPISVSELMKIVSKKTSTILNIADLIREVSTILNSRYLAPTEIKLAKIQLNQFVGKRRLSGTNMDIAVLFALFNAVPTAAPTSSASSIPASIPHPPSPASSISSTYSVSSTQTTDSPPSSASASSDNRMIHYFNEKWFRFMTENGYEEIADVIREKIVKDPDICESEVDKLVYQHMPHLQMFNEQWERRLSAEFHLDDEAIDSILKDLLRQYVRDDAFKLASIEVLSKLVKAFVEEKAGIFIRVRNQEVLNKLSQAELQWLEQRKRTSELLNIRNPNELQQRILLIKVEMERELRIWRGRFNEKHWNQTLRSQMIQRYGYTDSQLTLWDLAAIFREAETLNSFEKSVHEFAWEKNSAQLTANSKLILATIGIPEFNIPFTDDDSTHHLREHPRILNLRINEQKNSIIEALVNKIPFDLAQPIVSDDKIERRKRNLRNELNKVSGDVSTWPKQMNVLVDQVCWELLLISRYDQKDTLKTKSDNIISRGPLLPHVKAILQELPIPKPLEPSPQPK